MGIAFDSNWLARLRASISHPPRQARIPVLFGDSPIGSIEPDLLRGAMGGAHGVDGSTPQAYPWSDDGKSLVLSGNGTEALRRLALALREQNLGHVHAQWRDEQLAVWDCHGREVATVERGAVRVLGIATRAVHLVGRTLDDKVWIQQRAWSKATDPGLWDTLMGGMVSAVDTLESALTRETWEEAGLHLDQLMHLRSGGQVGISKPNSTDGGVGYVVERIDWFECLVPDNVEPHNQDGEVAQFARVEPSQLQSLMESDAFTAEAALILVHCLGDEASRVAAQRQNAT